MYVLDTDVFSVTSPTSGFSSAAVDAWRLWVERNENGLYLSVVTILEVRFGIEKCLVKGATKQAERLQRWLTAAETTHRSRIIPVTIEIAHKAGELLYGAVAAGVTPSSEDAIVAATACVKGFQVLSRNAKHMNVLQVGWFDPLESIPPDVSR
jgi:predicted nucleic acid-binding protein